LATGAGQCARREEGNEPASLHGTNMPRSRRFHNCKKCRMTCDAMSQMRVASLDDLQVFLRAAELGGFSLAARELHLSAGAVSKQIARLERGSGRAYR
jgi:hypothetical protein